jgi:hypothetical protein
MDIIQFSKQLAQTIVWVDRFTKDFDYECGNYGTVLRKTNPIINGLRLYNVDVDYATWNVDDYNVQNFNLALCTLLEYRNSELESYPNVVTELKSVGRILCFSTLVTTHDGMAISDSQCFVDESDVPPIDTWFYLEPHFLDMHRPTLFCWIPIAFQGVMKKAMKAEIMESYDWLDEVAPVFYEKVTKILRSNNLG